MNEPEEILNYFNEHGRRIPGKAFRVFGQSPSFYYQLEQPSIDYPTILAGSLKQAIVPVNLTAEAFEKKAKEILVLIKSSPAYANLLHGVHVPFVYFDESAVDFGMDLEGTLLPKVQEAFRERFPDAHFKALLQSDSTLPEHIALDPQSRYQDFVEASRKGPVVGWFFPQATQEFDIQSQRQQMSELPMIEGAGGCFRGGKDVCAALVGSPDLLISDDHYAPILCLSAYVHTDPRLVLLIKAYGPHMEFWCMTQMLTKDTTQVSEQWAGGVTIFATL